MYTTSSERETVKDEFLSDLMSMEPGDTHDYYFGVTVECVLTEAGSLFTLDGIDGYGLFAAADTLTDKHRQYCQ